MKSNQLPFSGAIKGLAVGVIALGLAACTPGVPEHDLPTTVTNTSPSSNFQSIAYDPDALSPQVPDTQDAGAPQTTDAGSGGGNCVPNPFNNFCE